MYDIVAGWQGGLTGCLLQAVWCVSRGGVGGAVVWIVNHVGCMLGRLWGSTVCWLPPGWVSCWFQQLAKRLMVVLCAELARVCVCVTQLRCGLGEHVGVTAKPVLLLPPRHTMPALVWLFGQLLQAAVFGHCPVARAPAAGF